MVNGCHDFSFCDLFMAAFDRVYYTEHTQFFFSYFSDLSCCPFGNSLKNSLGRFLIGPRECETKYFTLVDDVNEPWEFVRGSCSRFNAIKMFFPEDYSSLRESRVFPCRVIMSRAMLVSR